MSQRLNGYLNVLKPPGLTSQQVVAFIRRLTGARRVGHTGTLDPAAVGVLPVAIGPATRTTNGDAWDTKVYWADVRFGTATETDDAEGVTLRKGDPSSLDLQQLRGTLEAFVGEIDQRPPAYSAVHVGGKRAYAAARAGAPLALAPRRVRVDSITPLAWDPPVLSVLVRCGSGTYLRSLARDLGEAVGCPAHLAALVRLGVGPFDVRDALSREDLEAVARRDAWESVLWAADIAAWDSPAVVVGRGRAVAFGHGQAWPAGAASEGIKARVYSETGAFLGMARSTAEQRWQPTVVLGGAEAGG